MSLGLRRLLKQHIEYSFTAITLKAKQWHWSPRSPDLIIGYTICFMMITNQPTKLYSSTTHQQQLKRPPLNTSFADQSFLSERDYATFGYLLSQIRLSVVCLSVTFVHPTRGLKLSAIFLHRCVPWMTPNFRMLSHERYKMWPRLQLMTTRKWHMGNSLM